MNLIYGTDIFLLNERRNQLLAEWKKTEATIDIFSCEEDDFGEIVTSIKTPPMFTNNKIIILLDPLILSNKKLIKDDGSGLQLLQTIAKGYPSNNKVLFILNEEKLSKTKNIVNFLKHCQIENISKPTFNSAQEKVKSWLKADQLTLSNQAWQYFWSIEPIEMNHLWNEIQKLKNIHKSNLDLSDVKSLLTPFLENDIFKLSTAFMANDLNGFLQLLQSYMKQNLDLYALTGLLASNLITVRNYLVLKKANFSHQACLERLGVNPYYMSSLLRANHETIDEINDKIISIYALNKELISGTIDKQIIPEYKFIKVFQKSTEKGPK